LEPQAAARLTCPLILPFLKENNNFIMAMKCFLKHNHHKKNITNQIKFKIIDRMKVDFGHKSKQTIL
jgi:hypothetical protein